MTTTSPRIAIVGGGISGLSLLLTLHHCGIPATVYERDSGFFARAHLGGTLDLGWDSGQRALRENGLEDEFNKYARPEADEFKLLDRAGNVLLAKSGEANVEKDPRDVRPEIDRTRLRKLFLDAVPVDSVKWGHSLSSIRPLGGGEHELTFANGATTISDVLVGADGANSRVRPLLSPATPIYDGVTGSEISIAPKVAARPEFKDVVDAVGNGSAIAVGDHKNIFFQRNGDGRIRGYVWFQGPENWRTPSQPGEARKALLEIFNDWAPWMRKFIEHCDDAAIYHRPLYHLAPGHCWDHVDGVTLIGDGAHLTSPYGGAGANLAMMDGLGLGLVLAENISGGGSGQDREAAVAVWEEKMCTNAGKVVATSVESIALYFSPDAPGSVVEVTREFMMDPDARRGR